MVDMKVLTRVVRMAVSTVVMLVAATVAWKVDQLVVE